MNTVVITGASKGIGRACAIKFAEAGYNVVIGYNSSVKKALELENELKIKGYSAIAVKADVSSTEDIKNLLRSAHDAFGNISVLINNAGVAATKIINDVTDTEFNSLNSINYGAVFKACREVLPYMLSVHRGSIVNVSSVWGISGASCEVAYSASKAAVIGLTKALAKELGPSGIRVNCVAPGVIDTDMNSCYDEKTMSDLASQSSLCRIGKPEEVAEAIYFLASEKASYITGQVLTVDGGFI